MWFAARYKYTARRKSIAAQSERKTARIYSRRSLAFFAAAGYNSQRISKRPCIEGFAPTVKDRLRPHGRFLLLPRARGGFFMSENRVAAVSIIVENIEHTDRLNAVLHEYGNYIIGRMGIPYRAKNISVLSVVLDAPQETINALTGKLGMIEGVYAKTLFSKF